MGRSPCCDKANVKKGPWSPEEDARLKSYIERHGTGGNWIALPLKIGLKRCGKSCRLRWLNYLRPNLKRGGFSEEEDNIICSLYTSIGSRWSVMAGRLPGRTDNDIKNYWNTTLKKKLFGKKHNSKQQRKPRKKKHQPKQQDSSATDADAGVVTDGARRNASATPQPALPRHGELDAVAVSSSSSSFSSLRGASSGLSTELSELLRLDSARLEELDCWLDGVEGGVDWNEDMMSPLMASSPGALHELCAGMQCCWPPFEEELQIGMRYW